MQHDAKPRQNQLRLPYAAACWYTARLASAGTVHSQNRIKKLGIYCVSHPRYNVCGKVRLVTIHNACQYVLKYKIIRFFINCLPNRDSTLHISAC